MPIDIWKVTQVVKENGFENRQACKIVHGFESHTFLSRLMPTLCSISIKDIILPS